MTGKIVQVSISPGGVPKTAIDEGRLTAGGFEGDSWRHPQSHGGPLKAVLMMSLEVIDALKSRGYPVFPGATGENLTTEGLVYAELREGSRLRAGKALLEITRVRKPCATLDVYGASIKAEIYDSRVQTGDFTSPIWGWSGFYTKVLEPGIIRPGDIISVEP